MPFSLEYDKGKLKSVIGGLQNLAQNMDKNLRVAMTASVLDVQTDAVTNAPYRTGTLRRSITHKVEGSGKTVAGYVGSNLVYSRIQEMGGNAGRNKSVRIKPKRYLERAIESNRSKINTRFRKLGLVKG